jgi:Fic family protein
MKIADFIRQHQEYFEDFVTRSTYHSNAIEGSTLSYAETYAVIFNDNSLQVRAEPRELYEAINHKYAMDLVLKKVDEGEPLSEEMIKKIAVTINKNINEIAGYRTTQVYIRGAEHLPPAPEAIAMMMAQWLDGYEQTNFASVYQKIAVTHGQLEKIHPFVDGNGRTGRLLINFELLKNDLPPAVIPKESRSEYFAMLAEERSDELANLIEKLSEEEGERMGRFGEADER